MPSKNSPSKRRRAALKTRPLRLRITVKAPKKVSASERIRTLIDVVRAGGNYTLPNGWSARIEWSNDGGKTVKEDEFSKAMRESAESSRGWDGAVIAYLEGKL